MEKRKTRGRQSAFDEWGIYMKSKKLKLESQFNRNVSEEKIWNDSRCANIFKGVAIFVNGYTRPSANELKRLMQLHGGIYCHYYSNSSTTHIIATNLANSKVHGLKGKKIVHPDWITDSIKQGKLLPYNSYLLYKNKLPSGQKQLRAECPFNLNGSIKSKDQPPDFLSTRVSDGQKYSFNSEKSITHHDNILTNLSELEDSDLIHEKSVEDLPVNHNFKPLKESILSTQNKSSSKTGEAKESHFLSEFYNKSRLHHISTIGAEFKEYVIKLRKDSSGKFEGKKKLQHWKNRKVQATASITHEKDQETHKNSLFYFNKCQRIPNEDIAKQKIIMHIDMDCFFASVGLRNRPEMNGKPVAVAHSRGRDVRPCVGADPEFELKYYQQKMKDKALKKFESSEMYHKNSNFITSPYLETEIHSNAPTSVWGSTSEIACCNYEARKAGVCNGMFLGHALKLCPDLQTIPYEFEEYKNVSKLLYDTVSSYTLCIEAVSCDEMFVDCTDLLIETNTTPLEFAMFLREEIKQKTGCTASAGFANNKLLARMATKVAKPNGQFYLEPDKVEEFIKLQKVKDMPGVGSVTAAKLEHMGVLLCEQLQLLPLGKLKQTFGPKTGQLLYNHCRGYDGRKIATERERKSVSAEINYGIRFQQEKDAYDFLSELAEEVHCRLNKINMKGRSLTLKLKVRSKNAPTESYKFMGHGVCDNVTKSSVLPFATDDKKVISKECIILLKSLNIIPQDMRGMGIQVGRLEGTFPDKQQEKNLSYFLKKKKLDICNNDIFKPSISPLKNPLPVNYSHKYSMESVQHAAEKYKIPHLCGAVSVDDVKTLLAEWIETTKEPSEEDESIFTNYISDVVKERNLEKLDLIIKCFYRLSKKGGSSWQEVFQSVIDTMQLEVLQIYNNSLKVNVEF